MQKIADSFEKEIHKKVYSSQTIQHPLFDELIMNPKNIELLRLVSLEGYHLVEIFPKYIAALLHNCPNDEFRPIFAANLYEEETGGISKTARHVDLMRRFLKSLGINEEQIH